nr:tetratricopeptide repeat protein 29-like [Labrus bergylta]
MNAAVAQRHAASFLPDITQNRKRHRKSFHHSWMKETLGAAVASDPSDDLLLSRADVSKFKNPLKQIVCVEMLQEGFHRSYSELFFLLTCDQNRRAATPLEEQQDKLETMRRHLSRAEQAERTSSWTVACEQRLFLGGFFSSVEDLWISLHFYHSCAEREHGGRSRPATEARVCLSEVYLQTGDVEQARQQAERCIQQVEEGGWLDSDGRPLRLRGRMVLWRIYSRMADSLLDAEDYNEALTLLHRGYSMAAASEDKQVEAEAAYRLGLTNQRAGDHNTAKQFFNMCMKIFGTLEDADGLGKSYKAMAKSLESEENVDETVRCLEKLADISLKSGLQHNLVDAYLSLGNIYFNRSQYLRACEFFLQGYEVARDLGDIPLLEKSQVFVATARAQCLIRKYTADLKSATPTALQ